MAKRKKPIIAQTSVTVDRREFAAWTEGILMELHEGRGIVPNELECEAADAALARGESVLFRDGARLTGTMMVRRRRKGVLGYYEVPVA